MDCLEGSYDKEIPENILHEFEIPYKLNAKFIRGKKITFTDSVQETKTLTEVVEKLDGKVIGVYEYLFNQDKVDIVVCNRKCYIKTFETETTVREEKFIDSLI